MNGNTKWFEGEKALVLTALLGFALAAFCGGWTLLFGGEIGAEGDVSKAFSFNAALGVFLLSTAAVAPYSALRPRGRAFFRWGYIMLALYSYFAETVQHFRGVNPRFVEGGSAFDAAVGFIFATVAMLLILFYIAFAVSFFVPKAYAKAPLLVLSVRYAMAAVVVSFAAGLWISVNGGQHIGSTGNIIWLHGLGFHAMQALPFAAWLAGRKAVSRPSGLARIHVTGIAFILGLIAIGWQTALGHAILEWSALPLIAFACFGLAAAPVVQLLLAPRYRSFKAAA